MEEEVYCYRCSRQFRYRIDLLRHIENSPRHFPCSVLDCGYDGSSWQSTLDHARDSGHCLAVCQGCDGGEGSIWFDEDDYQRHLEDEFVCGPCERHFKSGNHLYNHERNHLHCSLPCYACPQKFKGFSHMILHIDGGYCPSGLTSLHLNRAAALCPEWEGYINAFSRNALLEGVEIVQGWPFECRDCQELFSKLSGLIQHTASEGCPRSLKDGAVGCLVEYLDQCYKASGKPDNPIKLEY